MALDNPSYFSVAGASGATARTPTFGGLFNPAKFKMGNVPSTSTSENPTMDLHQPPQGALQTRRALRSLLRSVSSNSADSNQELLIMGEPRPSDIAPPSPYLPAHRHSPNGSVNESRRSSSLKKTRKYKTSDPLQQGDLIYNSLPTSEDAVAIDVNNSDEEVFLAEDQASARYYNFSAIPVDKRRHSIGTFMARERVCSVASSSKSFKEDFPQAIVHATADGDLVRPIEDVHVPAAAPVVTTAPLISTRRPCNRCTRGIQARTRVVMDDILIVSSRHSQTAALWVEYFTSCFNQISEQAKRKPFKIHKIGAEDVTSTSNDFEILEKRSHGVKLQVIIICPGLLEHINENPEPSSALRRLFSPDRALALLLGVTDQDITDVHRNAFSNYNIWQRLSVGQDQDETFANEFLGLAMSILSRMWQKNSSLNTKAKSHFSIMPKKVKQGQNSVAVHLTDPLHKEDTVKVSVERNNEIFEVPSVKRRNPYTLKFSIPNNCLEISAIVNILVEKNGSILGSRPIKCESRLRELDQILRSSDNPLEFMCQTLCLPIDKDTLDNWMVHNFQKNLPPNFNLVYASNFPGIHSSQLLVHGHEEYPTLLHFAARFGLEKLSLLLLECPGGDLACEIKNACDLTPTEIAENAGHTDLAHILGGYMKMNEFTNLYSKLKEMSLNPSKITGINEDTEYLVPRELEGNEYKVCPPPRPVHPDHKRSPSPLPPPNHLSSGYMAMKNSTETPGKLFSKASNSKLDIHNSKNSLASSPTVHQKDFPGERDNNSHFGGSTLKLAKNDVLNMDKVQRELAEIMIDVKNNVHTIVQAEQLVEEWKKRNDVQKSYKEKSEQLKEMRLQYERFQESMKDEKRSNPFERIKKIFGWSSSSPKSSLKSSPSVSDVDAKKNENANFTLLAKPQETGSICSSHRPISSLSIQSTSSSASSGRMSTISNGSMGDSGTHSDPDERKQITGEYDVKQHHFSNFNNYTIPPAPRPFRPNKKPFDTIEERPPHPPPRYGCEDEEETNYIQPQLKREECFTEHYIKFPPSNLPVNSHLTKRLEQHQEVEEVEYEAKYLECLELNSPESVRSLPVTEESIKILEQESSNGKCFKDGERNSANQEYMNFPSEGMKMADETQEFPHYMNYKLPPTSN